MTLRTLDYGTYGIFLILGHAGFWPPAVVSLGSFFGVSSVLNDVQVGLDVQGSGLGTYSRSQKVGTSLSSCP